MVSVNYQNNIQNSYLSGIRKVNPAPFTVPINNSQPTNNIPPTFKSDGYRTSLTIRTELTTSYEKKKYNELSAELDSKYRKKLEYALKSGILYKKPTPFTNTVQNTKKSVPLANPKRFSINLNTLICKAIGL